MTKYGDDCAKITFFDATGKPCGLGANQFLPTYLDWMPIEVKVFWFLERGSGNPDATRMLFHSQGEQRLVDIPTPLRILTLKELQEKDNGIEGRVQDFIDQGGWSRVPRNQ